MDIKFVTICRIYNYGSVLQAYATQQVFRSLGYEVSMIDYVTPQRTFLHKLKLVPPNYQKYSLLKKIMYRVTKSLSVIWKEVTFSGFINTNIKRTKKYITYEQLTKDVPIADVYVTGSDQTWNSYYNGGIDLGFFLAFAPEGKKRIAFVASFGKNELSVEEKEETAQLLKKYNAISVRENQALNILHSIGMTNGVWLIDPTLQVSKKEWMQIASKRLIKEKYLILMLLYNEDNHATEFARKIADDKGLKLVKLSWELFKPKDIDVLMTHRSPEDFLSLFGNADFVVTNSFHGLAFSINLNRQFIVVPRNEFNSRISSLLDLVGLNNRMVSTEGKCSEVMNQFIDYEPINKILLDEREKAKQFIQENIG